MTCPTIILVLLLAGCRAAPEPALSVAAAANLQEVFIEIGRRFTVQSGKRVRFSFGATAQLAQQIEHGAPFDVFAAADREHVDALQKKGLILPTPAGVYARGRLALWAPRQRLAGPADLTNPEVKVIAIAKPEVAPYGKAAVEALRSLRLWEQLQAKIVYGENISMARSYAESGNADAAFTSYSLVRNASGSVISIDEKLYSPIEQAVGVCRGPRAQEGSRFVEFLLSAEARRILQNNGYSVN